MWHVVSDGGWIPMSWAVLRIFSLRAWFGTYTPESRRAIARRIAFRRRLCVTYQSRGRPGGSGRFSTGSYGRSSRTALLDVDWVGSGLSAAAGTGILLSRSGNRPASPAAPSNTTYSLPAPTDNQRAQDVQ